MSKIYPDYLNIDSKHEEMFKEVLQEKIKSLKEKLEKRFKKDNQQQAVHEEMTDQDKAQLEETLEQMFKKDKRHLQVMLEQIYNQDKKPLKEMLEDMLKKDMTQDAEMQEKMYDRKKKELEEKLERLILEYNESQHFLQMDLLSQILILKPETRPTAQQILHHPLCWDDKKCLEFIFAIRQKFDILDQNENKNKKNIKNTKNFQMVLRNKPFFQRTKDALDENTLYENIGWMEKLDKNLADDVGTKYNTKLVSELLRAIRNKVLGSFVSVTFNLH